MTACQKGTMPNSSMPKGNMPKDSMPKYRGAYKYPALNVRNNKNNDKSV